MEKHEKMKVVIYIDLYELWVSRLVIWVFEIVFWLSGQTDPYPPPSVALLAGGGD